MIESQIEHKYDIMLSLFLGFIIALIINHCYSKPITQTIYKK